MKNVRKVLFVSFGIVICCLLSLSLVAQEEGKDSLGNAKETFPRFPGNVIDWIYSHIDYPKTAWMRGEEGIVYVSFVIHQDGSVGKVDVLREGFPELDRAARDLIASMPAWIPGKSEGMQKDFSYTIPVVFSLKAVEPPMPEDYETYIKFIAREQELLRSRLDTGRMSDLLYEKYLNLLYGYNNKVVYKVVYRKLKIKQQTTEFLLGLTVPSLDFSDEDKSFIFNEYKKEWSEQIRLIDSIPSDTFIKSYARVVDKFWDNAIQREINLQQFLGEQKFKQYVEGCILHARRLILKNTNNVLVGKWELIQRNNERPASPEYKSFYSNYRFEDSRGNVGTYRFGRESYYQENGEISTVGDVVDYNGTYWYSINNSILILTGEIQQTQTDGSVKIQKIKETWKRIE